MKNLNNKNKILYIMDKRSRTSLEIKKTNNIHTKTSKKSDYYNRISYISDSDYSRSSYSEWYETINPD